MSLTDPALSVTHSALLVRVLHAGWLPAAGSVAAPRYCPAGPLPLTGAKHDWLAYIALLPDSDSPELFGLPANIERAVAVSSSRRLLAALRQMQVSQVGSR
jgi:hypothetical protein